MCGKLWMVLDLHDCVLRYGYRCERGIQFDKEIDKDSKFCYRHIALHSSFTLDVIGNWQRKDMFDVAYDKSPL